MKKIVLLVLSLTIAMSAWAYDFSYTYSGKTLYYNITSSTSHTVAVTYPSSSIIAPYCGYTEPTGGVTIPSSVTNSGVTYTVTRIDSWAFYECTGITSINIPSSVTSYIQPSAFWGCSGLSSIVINSGNTAYDSRNNCNAIIKTSTNQLLIGCKNTTIPNSVLSIANNAFDGCTGLTYITIPGSVTSIGDKAFYNCSGLTSVTIPNSVTSIGGSAFGGCSGLTYITIPSSVTSIVGNAFSNCSGLMSISVSSGNTVYDSRENCKAIIKTASNRLIAGCKNTTIPATVTSIGSFAFSGCSGLTSITIPSSVNSIGRYAFSGCSGLTSIVIPSSVDSIGDNVFMGCSGLNTIICYANNPPVIVGSSSYFGNCGHIVDTLIVPCNRESNYSSWSSFFSEITCVNLYTVSVQCNNAFFGTVLGAGNYIQGSAVSISATANYGYHFIRWNDNVTTNPRTVQLISDTAFIAFFEPNQYTVSVSADNPNFGTVSGNGTFDYGSTISLVATPQSHCHFVRWSDNNTENPRNLTVENDISLTAYFAMDQHHVSAISDNPDWGIVSGGGNYNYGSCVTLIALPIDSHRQFISWNDGDTNATRTITLISDTSFTAFFTSDRYSVSASSAQPAMGFVTGDGIYDYGSTATVTAHPNNGYQFLYWNDGNGSISRTFVVTRDREFVAYFGQEQGIDDVENGSHVCLYPNPASERVTLQLQGLTGTRNLTITDLVGREMLRQSIQKETFTFSVSSWPKGTYFLKVIDYDGTIATRKLMVR